MTFFISVGRTVGGDLSVSRSEQTVATADHGQRSDLGVHDHMWRAMRSTVAMGWRPADSSTCRWWMVIALADSNVHAHAW